MIAALGRAAGLSLAALSLAVLASGAQAAEVERIDVVDKGIYEIVTGEATADPNAPTDVITAVDSEKLVEATDKIAARLGLEFGFRYVLIGAPAGEAVSLDMVYTYPAPGMKDPAEAEPFLETRYARDKIIGDTIYVGYGFEADWEIVPGVWTFGIWHDGTKLAEESFTVSAE